MTAHAPHLGQLERQIDRALAGADAELGIFVRHVESGVEIARNPDALYPLASVVKVPILIEALAQVDEERLSLDTRYELRQEEKVLPSGVLVELDAGLQPTLHDLLTLMTIISDNTATDMVLRAVGIENVEHRLRSHGVEAISVRLTIQGLFDSAFVTPDVRLVPAEASAALQSQERDWECLANRRSRENNVASPRDMGRLLELLVSGTLLSDRSTAVALDILLRQQLNARLPRFMPATVKIAHKTGTFMQSRNDAGIIRLPDGTHLIVVCFAILRREPLDADPLQLAPYIDRIDSAMGHIARAAYDAFT